ncbi:unnamed protein product [Cyclocybe aegerita]|uniref:Uncharacterized protein n=1 Tax=Cyclocybe aegerita TaxID=1973307 RepID=A0A8S0VWH2_CYCAE|nr:unnamed protein product [Cyclocybe aegerita]
MSTFTTNKTITPTQCISQTPEPLLQYGRPSCAVARAAVTTLLLRSLNSFFGLVPSHAPVEAAMRAARTVDAWAAAATRVFEGSIGVCAGDEVSASGLGTLILGKRTGDLTLMNPLSLLRNSCTLHEALFRGLATASLLITDYPNDTTQPGFGLILPPHIVAADISVRCTVVPAFVIITAGCFRIFSIVRAPAVYLY